MRICVVGGGGAIGGYLAVALARAGNQVTVMARGATLAAIRERGLQLIMPETGETLAAQVKSVESVTHGERHGAEVHGHVVAHRDGFAQGVIHCTGIIAPFLDVGAEGCLAQYGAHFVGDRDEEIAEDFEIGCASAHNKPWRTHSCVPRRDSSRRILRRSTRQINSQAPS